MMSQTLLQILLALVSLASGADLWLSTTPQMPMPYALKKGSGIKLGENTFPVTGNSSGKAFCILNTNTGSSAGAGVFPHVHKKTYENFYAVKGRIQLWGQNLDSFLANTSIQQTRILSQGDIGAIPPNTIHTFTLLEPDTQLTGVLVPGGFEEFFFHMNLNPNQSSLPGAGGFDRDGLASWDVYPQLDFVPRRDVVNGRGGPGNWYDGPNSLPPDMSAPIWVAKNYGPKYLNSEHGRYQIITPLVTRQQTNNTFSQGTITVSPYRFGENPPAVNSTVATAMMLEEGQLQVKVDGYEPASLIDGDVVFVPAHVSFTYSATAEFTKFMYVTGGVGGLDGQLIGKGQTWNSAFYPETGKDASSKDKLVRF